jgi:pectate lyase
MDTTNANKGVFNPVVGWLVCIKGASRGADFQIHSQYNYIGRAKHMDICIPTDPHISAEKAAVLAYDNNDKTFFFAPGSGHNLVRVNGSVVMTPVVLKEYDVLTIGETQLLFVPLCGDHFDWNNQ